MLLNNTRVIVLTYCCVPARYSFEIPNISIITTRSVPTPDENRLRMYKYIIKIRTLPSLKIQYISRIQTDPLQSPERSLTSRVGTKFGVCRRFAEYPENPIRPTRIPRFIFNHKLSRGAPAAERLFCLSSVRST